MTLRVHINPIYDTPDQADGGIRRVSDAQRRWLGEFGVEVVRDPAQADVCAAHGTLRPPRTDVPFVSHCHGLYWAEYQWPGWAEAANAAVIDSMTRAQAVTAPSQWVARAIARGMLIHPEVIYHGVDADEWTPGESQGYVLWNKARTDAVSDPRPVMRLAELLPDVPFVTTFGERRSNVMVTGAMPVHAMRDAVQRAGLYLATTRETFGIGTLEALAAGVPVVGWAFGGQREIVTEGETGYLVPEGDYDALAESIRRALSERDRLSAAARNDAVARWGWRHRIAQYADLYKRVHAEAAAARPRVSVVITTYNLNQYLAEAVASARDADEVIVVDDCGQEDARAVYPDAIRPPENLGLSGARNFGAQRASGTYLLFLDADDRLAPGALPSLAAALDRDPSLHIAAGGLAIIHGDGRIENNPWPSGFNWREQAAHLNSLHYAALWRREAFLRSGGYRPRDWRAEDASHWLRVTSQGLRVEQVTNAPTLLYRIRQDSKSQQEAKQHPDKDGDWTSWFPWRMGATSARHGRQLLDAGAKPDPRRVPFGAPVDAPRKAWPVSHREHPLVSVVIPVGPGHAEHLVDALDSLLAQTWGDWEAIVVNDTGDVLPETGHPWAQHATVVKGRAGAGAARNLGLLEARAPLVLFLDADDVLRPEALETLVRAYAAGGASYVYPDCLVLRADGRLSDVAIQPWEVLPSYRDDATDAASVAVASPYDQAAFLASGYEPGKPGRHSVTALVETAAARDVGGFDEAMTGFEDWEFYLKLADAGHCGRRVPVPLLVYRVATGSRRRQAKKDEKKLIATMRARYGGRMPRKGCCGGNAAAQKLAQERLQAAEAPAPEAVIPPQEATLVRMRYTGDLVGEHSVTGRGSGKVYRVGNNAHSKYYNADPRDVAFLTSLGEHEVVR